jgi:hypothetical protein
MLIPEHRYTAQEEDKSNVTHKSSGIITFVDKFLCPRSLIASNLLDRSDVTCCINKTLDACGALHKELFGTK